MDDNSKETNKVALMDTVMESGAKKAGENIVNRGLNALVDFVVDKYGKARVILGTAFQLYLGNATERYNQVRTLATGQTPRKIIGPDNIYVKVGLQYGKKEIDSSTVEPMLCVSRNLLISGTGGVGKSMLMRYLFLNTANRGEYVPVLVELRRINSQPQGQLSILELIYSCMEGFNVQLPQEQFEYSLQLGKYLFLFDGLDEVKFSLTKETAEALQAFSSKYPQNPCIISSRPMKEISPLETFTIMESKPLSKEQAIALASKIRIEDEKAREFCHQLKENLFDLHKDFAENPLLLTMMFLTFMRNSSIPDHLADFYKNAYDALYSVHDSHDKGNYRRDFQCKTLDEDTFKRLFSHFCFQSYMKEIYEFSEAEILSRINKSIEKLKIDNIVPADYLTDLRNVVCMVIQDGNTYRFSHRSFQAYFAAYYTSYTLTDEQQKQLFASILSNLSYWNKRDYGALLAQIEPERFTANALEDGLRNLCINATNEPDPDIYIFKRWCDGIDLFDLEEGSITFCIDGDGYIYNIVDLFSTYVKSPPFDSASRSTNISIIKGYIEKFDLNGSTDLEFDTIDNSDCLSESERTTFYSALVQCCRTGKIYSLISDWLNEIDAKRASLNSPDFIDAL